MSLDFPNTCGDIDGQMSEAKGYIRESLERAVEELSPISNGTQAGTDWVSAELVYVWHKVDACFEELRELNVKMREAADDQISDLKDTISELEAEALNHE